MGVLSFRYKSYFLDLFKLLNRLNWFIVFLSLINLSVCIYEDQIGKFDWRQTYVGRIKFAQFDTVSTAKKIIVATEENVLAALNLKTGEVVWRHMLESASSGNVQLLHVRDKVVTVTGNNPYMVRGWDTATGVLLWEWALAHQSERSDQSEWWLEKGMLVHMVPVYGSHIEVTTYNVMTGQNRGATGRLPAVWIHEGCQLAAPYYTCLSGSPGSQLLLSLDVTSQAIQIISRPLSELLKPDPDHETTLRPLDGSSMLPGYVLDEKKIILVKENEFEVLSVKLMDSASITIVDGGGEPILMQAWQDEFMGFSLTAYNLATQQDASEIRAFDRALEIPQPEISAGMCSPTARGLLACRVLLVGGDDSLALLQQGGRVLWTREEALANVVAAEFVELPVSELDAAIESEFDQKEGSVWGAFSRRIQSQVQQLQTLIDGLSTPEGGQQPSPAALVRDYFSLHNVIVLLTDVGKIFGMDNLSGEILWRRYEPLLDPEGAMLLLRRSARHPPHDAYLTVVGKHIDTGNGVLISLNPITGALTGERFALLDTKLTQVSLLHQADDERLHALVLLDQELNVQVFPKSAESQVENFYMFVAEKETANVRGFALKYNGQEVIASPTWSLNLGGGPGSGHRIARLAAKPAGERVHSPGKALGDRSVLYKYLNPNLLLFITEGPDDLHKDIVVASCVDAVSGAVIAAQAHRRARATPYAVHSENFLAYAYYNDKLRRTEIATMELYEGVSRWDTAGGAFSSLAASQAPLVVSQTYIAPAAIAAAAVTRTERSLTDKHVLFGLSWGAVLEMPWSYLEPRRPVAPTAEQREEGLIAYAPELPLMADAILNYNRSVARIRDIHTAPSGLESTSLVLVTGLDLYYTRVTPSKTFDLLKDDFDYYLITIVLAALIVATYSSKYFASRKMLRQAWK